jgi:hypothetical protein
VSLSRAPIVFTTRATAALAATAPPIGHDVGVVRCELVPVLAAGARHQRGCAGGAELRVCHCPSRGVEAALGDAVRHILRSCPEEKVIRPHAGPNIAFVADVEAFGQRRGYEPVRDAVSANHCAATRELAVTRREFRGRPEPATIGAFLHLGPKTSLKRFTVVTEKDRKHVSHRCEPFAMVVRAGAALQRRSDPPFIAQCSAGDILCH